MLAFNLRAQLSGAAQLAGVRTAVNSLPQDTPRPHISVVDSYAYEYGLAGNILGAQATLAVQCWADSADTARSIADTVQPLLRGWGYYLTERASGYDDEFGFNVEILTIQQYVHAEDIPAASYPPGVALTPTAGA